MYLYMRFYLFVLTTHIVHGSCVKAIEQLEGVGSLLLLCGIKDGAQIIKLGSNHLPHSARSPAFNV